MKLNNVEYGVLSSYLSSLYFYSPHGSTTLYISKRYTIQSGEDLSATFALFAQALGYLKEDVFSVPLPDTTWWNDFPVSQDFGLDKEYVTPRIDHTQSNTNAARSRQHPFHATLPNKSLSCAITPHHPPYINSFTTFSKDL
jgi:hypothetical protein